MAIKDCGSRAGAQTATKFLILEFIQLLPCFVVWGVLNTTNDGIATLLVFFSVLAGAPLLYCYYYEKDIRSMMLGGLKDRNHQVKEGLLACAGILAIIVGAYSAFWNLNRANQAWILTFNIPLKKDMATTVIFFIIFSFINPVLEEFFWRVFLAKNYKSGELYNLLVTFHYALYHLFVVQYISQSWSAAALLTINIFILGRFLVHMRDKSGLIVGTLAHLGADMGVAIIYCHLFSHYVQ